MNHVLVSLSRKHKKLLFTFAFASFELSVPKKNIKLIRICYAILWRTKMQLLFVSVRFLCKIFRRGTRFSKASYGRSLSPKVSICVHLPTTKGMKWMILLAYWHAAIRSFEPSWMSKSKESWQLKITFRTNYTILDVAEFISLPFVHFRAVSGNVIAELESCSVSRCQYFSSSWELDIKSCILSGTALCNNIHRRELPCGALLGLFAVATIAVPSNPSACIVYFYLK